MDTTDSSTPLDDDGRPFVIEACGDTMWDDVLAQPPYNPALPPFTPDTALQKVQLAEDACNSKEDPDKVSLADTLDTE